MKCPFCNGYFSKFDFDERTMKLWLARNKTIAQLEGEKAAIKKQQERQRIEDEKSEKQKMAERIKRHIQEEILCLKCPNRECRRVFNDFDNCMALQCEGCNTQVQSPNSLSVCTCVDLRIQNVLSCSTVLCIMPGECRKFQQMPCARQAMQMEFESRWKNET